MGAVGGRGERKSCPLGRGRGRGRGRRDNRFFGRAGPRKTRKKTPRNGPPPSDHDDLRNRRTTPPGRADTTIYRGRARVKTSMLCPPLLTQIRQLQPILQLCYTWRRTIDFVPGGCYHALSLMDATDRRRGWLIPTQAAEKSRKIGKNLQG